jgi:preprotein translocase subunit SecF
VVLALFLLGGEIIHDFAFALLVGVLIGTYSSIYVASPVAVFLTKLAPPGGTAPATT